MVIRGSAVTLVLLATALCAPAQAQTSAQPSQPEAPPPPPAYHTPPSPSPDAAAPTTRSTTQTEPTAIPPAPAANTNPDQLAAPVPQTPPPQRPIYPRLVPQRDVQLAEPALVLPRGTLTRIHILEGDLAILGAQGSGNIADGIVSILTGGLTVTLGYVYRDQLPAGYLYVFGGAAISRGVLLLSIRPDISDEALEFSHMPMTSEREVRQRLRFGERAFRKVADDSRLLRLLDGSLQCATGAAIVPFWFIPRDFKVKEPIDYFVIAAAALSVVSGVISLVSPSDAERRWSAYKRLRKRLRNRQVRPSVAQEPLP